MSSTSKSVTNARDNKLKKRLAEIAKREENKCCAECHQPLAKGSIWVSCTLGEFLCISCASVHRGLGTHISWIRSITLDKLTEEQVDYLDKTGNAKAAEYWEYHLPKNFVRPTTESRMYMFLKDKYEDKKWARKDNEPAAKEKKTVKSDPLPVFDPFIQEIPHKEKNVPAFDPFNLMNKCASQANEDNEIDLISFDEIKPKTAASSDWSLDFIQSSKKDETKQMKQEPKESIQTKQRIKTNKNDPFADLIQF